MAFRSTPPSGASYLLGYHRTVRQWSGGQRQPVRAAPECWSSSVMPRLAPWPALPTVQIGAEFFLPAGRTQAVIYSLAQKDTTGMSACPFACAGHQAAPPYSRPGKPGLSCESRDYLVAIFSTGTLPKWIQAVKRGLFCAHPFAGRPAPLQLEFASDAAA